MKDLDIVSICSRYSCIDFSNLLGFPNQLPKDAYFLRNGPKFNGEDLNSTLEHVANFKTFIESLRVKKEDIFILDCSMIRFKGNVDNGSKVFLSYLLSHLQIFGISFLKYGWRKRKNSR